MKDVMTMIFIVVVTIMIVMALDNIRQMKGITPMPLLTVSTIHVITYDLCVTCSSGIIIKNLDGKSTEQSVSTNLLFILFIMLITG